MNNKSSNLNIVSKKCSYGPIFIRILLSLIISTFVISTFPGQSFAQSHGNASNNGDRNDRSRRNNNSSNEGGSYNSSATNLSLANRNIPSEVIKLATDELKEGKKLTMMMVNLISFLNQDLSDREASYGTINVIGLEKPLNELMDALVRRDGKYPVIVGGVGSGKSALIEALIRKIQYQELPTGIFTNELQNTYYLKVSARNFMHNQIDIKAFMQVMSHLKFELNFDPVVVLTDVNHLEAQHLTVLAEMATAVDSIPVILEADEKAFSTSILSSAKFQRYATPIKLKAPTNTEVITLLKDSGHLAALQRRYKVDFNEEALMAAVEVSEDYRIDLSNPTRTLTMLEALAIKTNRVQKGQAHTVNKKEIFKFVSESTGVPVVAQDREAFIEYMAGLRKRVLEQVIGQDHIINGLIDQFQTALLSRGRKHSIAMIMGPTGVGKTYGAETIAKEFYGTKDRLLDLDMTQFKDEHQLNVLFGAGNGYLSSDTNKGTLCEFLDRMGSGGGMIVMNEFEEAHPNVVTRMMELFDKGYVRCGDGKIRYAGRTLFVLTSNKQSDKILPSSRVKNTTEAELDRIIGGISQDQMKKAWTEKASYTDQNGQIKNAVVERIDKWYYAKPLLLEQAIRITKMVVESYKKEQAHSDDLEISVDDSFSENLASAFYNEENGARQLKFMVQQNLSKAIQEFRNKHGAYSNKLVVTASLHPVMKTKSIITVTEENTDKTISIDGPSVPVGNKLFESDFRSRLTSLEANLKKEIFGQDEAISIFVGAVKSRYLKSETKKAVAGYLIGTTGTGKTQLGKSVAMQLFDRNDAYEIFSMGNIKHESDLGNIFSPGKGIIGSDSPGQLESFLNRFPDGGVLIFDEMSNAGGADLALRTQVYKRFYTILDEGKYETPSGKTYDMTKYVILFTGNDGEEQFRGLSSDSMINETYNQILKNPAIVKEILLKSGAPEAFLGRLAFTHMMRPATSKVKQLISKKMLAEWISDVEKAQPITIEYDDQFVAELSELMFTSGAGARALAQFLESYFGKLVSDGAFSLDWEKLLASGKKGTLKVRIESIKPKSIFYKGDKPDATKATLILESYFDGAIVGTHEVDITPIANFAPQVHHDDAYATAAHEMGHIVTSFTAITGKKPVKVTIVPEKIGTLSALGYAQYRSVPVKGHWTREKLVHMIAGLLAGSEAESHITGNATNAGRSNDVESAGKMARKVILENHLIKGLDSTHAFVDQNGNIVNNLPAKEAEIFESEVRKVMEEGGALAMETIKKQIRTINAGIELLMKHGSLSEEELDRLLARGKVAAETNQEIDLNGIVVTDAKASCENLLSP